MAKPTFSTQTVESRNSVVDSRLKPTAEMHILVGGSYTKDGEEHRYGHTALRVNTRLSGITYDFGRYGITRGIFGESGEGILRVWSSFDAYIKGENALNRVTTGFVYAIFDHQAKAATDYFGALIKVGTHLVVKDRAAMKVYKLTTDYHALGPNCTTLSVDGAKHAIPNIDAGSEKFNKPEDVLSGAERFALAANGGADRLFLPANLQAFLNSVSPSKAIRIERYGVRK